MKVLPLIILCTAALVNYSYSLNVECNFNNDLDYMELGNIYRCEVESDPNIDSKEMATISSVSGTHTRRRTNDDVLSFHADYKTIQYFPNRLELIFKNLKSIHIREANLKEVHQSDLKPFTQLESLCLAQNDIQTLEEDLFEFNKNLKIILFYECKITHIDPNVFDNLSKLTSMALTANPCINEGARSDSNKIARIVKSIQSGQCINPSIKKKVQTIQGANSGLTLEARIDRIEMLLAKVLKALNIDA